MEKTPGQEVGIPGRRDYLRAEKLITYQMDLMGSGLSPSEGEDRYMACTSALATGAPPFGEESYPMPPGTGMSGLPR